MNRRGLLIILSSPSGAGKSTLARRLMAWDPTLKFSVSATTRAPRPGETDGVEYYFRSRAQFEAMVAVASASRMRSGVERSSLPRTTSSPSPKPCQAASISSGAL